MNNDATMMTLARRALAHFKAGSTDQAAAVMPMAIEAYVDDKRYAAERQRIFKRLPLALALSIEIPAPGDYKAINVLNTPILLVRADDGVVRAMLNVCRHRGAQVCPQGSGSKRVFACPYHAWTYGQKGELIGRYGAETFGQVEAASLGLRELACAERSGLIWVMLTPGETFDIDQWLGDFAAELDTLALDEWHLHSQREIPGPGWKVTMDGYLEAYHHNLVHSDTVGQYTVGNLLVLDTYGPHQRLTFGRKSLASLDGLPEAQWDPGEHIRLIHSGFPNLSVSGILGDHCLVSQIFPGETPERTTTLQTVLVAQRPVDAAAQQDTETFSDLVLRAVRDEDYRIGQSIQDALHAGANEQFLFGRNEPAVQNYHRWVARFMAQRDSKRWDQLLEESE